MLALEGQIVLQTPLSSRGLFWNLASTWSLVNLFISLSTTGWYDVLGADVGHPGPGSQLPSVTSIVYSWDRYATKYAAATGIQQPRQEIIENFKTYIKQAITNFVRENGVPDCIFFFRDGVSEGEYLTVTKDEKDQMQGIILLPFTFREQLTNDLYFGSRNRRTMGICWREEA